MSLHCLDADYSTTRRVYRSESPGNAGADSAVPKAAESSDSIHGGLRSNGYRKVGGSVESPDNYVNEQPLISVVTVVLNACEHIEQTILSVLNQTYGNVEYIIVDGGSTDGTLDIVQKYEHAIDYWRSGPDGGLYEAMNEGISLATGKYIALLNAADWYSTDLLEKVAKAHDRASANCDSIIYTNYEYFHPDLLVSEKKVCTLKPWRGMTISHQAMFVGADVYKKIGCYDVSYRLAADYDFFLRAYAEKIKFIHLDTYGVFFRAGGRSLSGKLKSIREAARALSVAYGRYSAYHLRFLMIEYSGLLYYTYFKNALVSLAGDKNISALRKFRRKIAR